MTKGRDTIEREYAEAFGTKADAFCRAALEVLAAAQKIEIEKKLAEVFNKAAFAPTGETKVAENKATDKLFENATRAVININNRHEMNVYWRGWNEAVAACAATLRDAWVNIDYPIKYADGLYKNYLKLTVYTAGKLAPYQTPMLTTVKVGGDRDNPLTVREGVTSKQVMAELVAMIEGAGLLPTKFACCESLLVCRVHSS